MEKYTVSGMNCAACSARVENAVNAVPGVTSCAVSLLTSSMGVEGTASADSIIDAVRKAGYDASVSEATLEDRETPRLRNRFFNSLGFLILLMYVSMGHGMLGWPVPAILEDSTAAGITEAVLSGIIIGINNKFFVNGIKGLIHRAPNMDTLVCIGSAASYIYSIWALTAGRTNELYFDSSAMILVLITVGKWLEAYSKGKTTSALKALLDLTPQQAVLIKEGAEVTVSADEVKPGDIFVVRPGERIPVDGKVLTGTTAVDESSLTGESVPSDKSEGDEVFASCINMSGYITCETLKVGVDTAFAQVIKMVSDAAATKAPVSRIADKVSGIFVPAVIFISIVTLAIWLICGENFGFALARAVSVLVISCPCALGLATPVAIMVGNGVAAKNGILFKNAEALEQMGKTTVFALDKTGTVTNGKPEVTDVIPGDGVTTDELMKYAYSLEKQSEHPLSAAIVQYAEKKRVAAVNLTGFQAVIGKGLKAETDKGLLVGGSLKYIKESIKIGADTEALTETLADQGKTPLFFAIEKRLLGVIAVADTLKPDSVEAIKELENMGIETVMLTGDNKRTARAIGALAGIDSIVSDVLPGEKADAINKLQEKGLVAMAGDGINDAPALTAADTGIAIGAGTDVAMDAADIVIPGNRMKDLSAAVRLSRATLRNIHQNLFWAFLYNIICIPLAAGALISSLGLTLNPMIGAAAMSLSSLCVVSNALRLNFVKPFDNSKDKKKKTVKSSLNKISENKIEIKEGEDVMEKKKINIEGMMCAHCEARVKACLEALPEVDKASVSHKKNNAVLKLNANLSDDVLKKTIEDAGYNIK